MTNNSKHIEVEATLRLALEALEKAFAELNRLRSAWNVASAKII